MLNRFIKFVQSPYHNVNDNITQLCELLVDAIKNEDELPSKSEIWDHLKLKGKYIDVKFRKLCNDTLERFEKFIVVDSLDLKNLLKSNLLFEAAKNNNLELLLDKTVSKTKRLIDREMDQSADFYLQRYVFEKSTHSLLTGYEKKANIKDYINKFGVTEIQKYLDVFYCIEKLRFAADAISWKDYYKTKIEVNLGNTLQIISSNNLESFPAVKIYLYMYKILTEENDYESYNILKKIAFDNIQFFPKDEQRGIIDVLYSFCIKQINLDNEKYLFELLELYDSGINSEIVLVNNVLSPTTFRNYIVSGLRVGEFDRVEKFIIEKSVLLEESRRENAVNFNLARVFFYKKQFPKVLEYLNQVNYEDLFYNLNSKIYLMAVYYELKEHIVLESHLETFQAFVRRQSSIQDSVKKSYLNFVKHLKKIYRVNQRDKSALLNIKNSLEAEKTIINKSWLLEKIDELL